MARKSPTVTGIPCCFICHYFPDSIGKYQQEFQAHLEVTCKKKSLEANVSARKPPIPTQGSAQEIHQSPHHLLLHSIFQNCLCDCPQFLCLRRQLVQSFTIMLVAPEETKIILSMIFCHIIIFCMTAPSCLSAWQLPFTQSSPDVFSYKNLLQSLYLLLFIIPHTVTEPATRRKTNLPLHVHNQKQKELQGHRQAGKQCLIHACNFTRLNDHPPFLPRIGLELMILLSPAQWIYFLAQKV